jgi:hypothetical protein
MILLAELTIHLMVLLILLLLLLHFSLRAPDDRHAAG